MNKLEFLKAFYIKYDKVASQDAPGYTEEEISVFATQAQRELLLKYYDSAERKLVGAFEGSEKIKVYLDELVKNTSITTFSSDVYNFNSFSRYTELPEDCLFLIKERAFDERGEIRVKPVTHDYVEANKDNPYKEPYEWVGERLLWRVNLKGKIELICKDSIPTRYDISYIQYPEDINLAIEQEEPVSILDSITHFELLDMAIRIASIPTDTDLYQLRDKEAENNN